jgi:chromosome segregation ATPase
VNGLTKILIVLLTISSIFLCGIVATYVSNAQNYRLESDNQKDAASRANRLKVQAETQLADATKLYQDNEDTLNAQVAELSQKVQVLAAALKTANLENVANSQKIQNWVSMQSQLEETNNRIQKQLEEYLTRYQTAETAQTKMGKELDETRAELIAKLSVIDTIEQDKKGLEEEVVELRSKLDGILMRQGRVTGQYNPIASVTPSQPSVPTVPSMDRAINLKGTITGIQNSLAQISIGSAHGVKEGMQFFVTRGPAFICKIQIIDVQPEMAIGQILPGASGNPPRPGDGIATNL